MLSTKKPFLILPSLLTIDVVIIEPVLIITALLTIGAISSEKNASFFKTLENFIVYSLDIILLNGRNSDAKQSIGH
ncbi:MAG: hypothetical protein KZQ63_00415 [Candidatus Thiodiazotropha sp. (ex Lucinoma aequizonata)]|nr:hypothetical protein [Candidatus Thiodiazotropha sp. (ex Lucinoma aequizonata)]